MTENKTIADNEHADGAGFSDNTSNTADDGIDIANNNDKKLPSFSMCLLVLVCERLDITLPLLP